MTTIEMEAWRAVHTYICLASKHCADTWAEEMLRDCGFIYPHLTLPQLKVRFVNFRKTGKAPSVINPNMARKGNR